MEGTCDQDTRTMCDQRRDLQRLETSELPNEKTQQEDILLEKAMSCMEKAGESTQREKVMTMTLCPVHCH